MSDIVGRRSVFLTAQVVFLCGSVLCGSASDMTSLITARAIQGCGAGGLLSTNQIILADLIWPRDRGRYSGIFGAVFTVASIIGPYVGGLITDSVSWRWIFWINVPFGAANIMLTILFLRLNHVKAKHYLDVVGAALIVLFVATLMLALTWGGNDYAWTSSNIITLAVISGVCLLCFLVDQHLAREPIMPLRFFKIVTFIMANICASVTITIMTSVSTFLPMFLQISQGSSASESGLKLIPVALAVVVMFIITGNTMSRTGSYVWFPRGSMIIMVIACWCMSDLDVSWSYPRLCVLVVMIGLASGACGNQVVQTSVQNVVMSKDLATATSAVSFLRTLMSAVSVSVIAAVIDIKSNEYESDGYSHNEAFALGIGDSYLYVLPFVLIGVIASWCLPNIKLQGRAKIPTNQPVGQVSPPVSHTPGAEDSKEMTVIVVRDVNVEHHHHANSEVVVANNE